MKTKIFDIFAALALCVAVSATAQTIQYITLIKGISENFPIQTNQLVSVIGYDWVCRPAISGFLPNGTQIQLTPLTYAQIISPSATGMTNILLVSPPSGSPPGNFWATFQITTPTAANVVSNYVPADAIVIPASATGNVQIILESSPDLVNWTAASPGTYGASAGTNRFFRVRAAVSP
jgi:hypothetical protein